MPGGYRTERRQGVRLTRRGRVVLIAVSVALLLGAFWVGTRQGAVATSGGPAAVKGDASETVVVNRGDTLWDIANHTRPDTDPRATVLRLIELNDLSDPVVEPGRRLELPERGDEGALQSIPFV